MEVSTETSPSLLSGQKAAKNALALEKEMGYERFCGLRHFALTPPRFSPAACRPLALWRLLLQPAAGLGNILL